MANKKILIVEDNLVNQKLLLVVLRPHGYHLITAQDGEEAILTAKREQPDLILMDLQLPKISGYAATQTIKADPETTRIPVIALTAHAMEEEKKNAQLIGFDGYITKPIDTRSFPEQVRLILQEHTSGPSAPGT